MMLFAHLDLIIQLIYYCTVLSNTDQTFEWKFYVWKIAAEAKTIKNFVSFNHLQIWIRQWSNLLGSWSIERRWFAIRERFIQFPRRWWWNLLGELHSWWRRYESTCELIQWLKIQIRNYANAIPFVHSFKVSTQLLALAQEVLDLAKMLKSIQMHWNHWSVK